MSIISKREERETKAMERTAEALESIALSFAEFVRLLDRWLGVQK